MEKLAGDSSAEAPERRRRLQTIAVLVASATLVAAIAGAAIYRERVASFRTEVLIVDDRSVDMDYFLRRVRLSGERPLAMLPQLAIEEMIKLVAPQPPYRITVLDADIDAALAAMATRGAGEPTVNEFSEWYRQQLNESGLGDAEYRELVRVRLLARALSDHLAARVPTVAEQVRLQMIMQTTLSDAKAAKARLVAGEEFADLAAELNTDEKLKARAGELGWFPRDALAPALARTAFDELQVGEVSVAIPMGANRFAIVKVVERRDAVPIDEAMLQSIKSRALDAWAAQELKRHRVEYRGFDGGYDSETDAWVMRQLGHTRPERDKAQ